MKTKEDIEKEVKKDLVIKGAVEHFPECKIALKRAIRLTYNKTKNKIEKENGSQ